MTGSDAGFYLLAAYGVTLALLAGEVWILVRRSRARARQWRRGPGDEA